LRGLCGCPWKRTGNDLPTPATLALLRAVSSGALRFHCLRWCPQTNVEDQVTETLGTRILWHQRRTWNVYHAKVTATIEEVSLDSSSSRQTESQRLWLTDTRCGSASPWFQRHCPRSYGRTNRRLRKHQQNRSEAQYKLVHDLGQGHELGYTMTLAASLWPPTCEHFNTWLGTVGDSDFNDVSIFCASRGPHVSHRKSLHHLETESGTPLGNGAEIRHVPLCVGANKEQ
jgi:hypothetical protein